MSEEENKKVIVCRCKDVTQEEIEAAIDSGLTTMEDLKRVLRCGMGPCQGKTCGRLIQRILARKLKKSPAEVATNTDRPPVKAVELGVLAEGEEDE
jgi:NAD(P)H-nitrite reductase large subunit